MGDGAEEIIESMPIAVVPGCGNVFADLGLDDPEERLAKAQLVRRLCEIIEDGQLAEARVAELLGIDAPALDDLTRGKLDGFSTGRIFHFLNALGSDVEIVVRPVPRGERAGTRVISA